MIRGITGRLRVMQVASDLFDDAVAEHLGVNRTDLRILDLLERLGPLPPSRLAELNRMSRPAMTTAIDRLEKAGYARRVPDSSDRRRLLVEITPTAREYAMEIYGPVGERTQTELGRYTAKDLELISRFLDGAIQLTESQLERVRPSARSEAGPAGRERA